MNQNLVKWVGTVTTIISAVLVSASPHLATKAFSFVGYVIGSSCWLVYGLKTKDFPLTVLNIFYILINAFAIWARL